MIAGSARSGPATRINVSEPRSSLRGTLMKLAICLACFFSFAAHADETGCARISEGMSSLEVLRQCGQPPVVDFRQEERHADDGTVLRVDTVERERGPRTIYDTVE